MSEPRGPVDPADHDPGSEPLHDWPSPAAPTAESRSSGFLRGLREIVIVVILALVISAVVRSFLVQAFWVPTGSMEQTLTRGDRILVWKPGGDPQRGDVIVFRDPANWLPDQVPESGLRGAMSRVAAFVGVLPSTTGDDLVKRVIGVGGDTVECCSPSGRIIRNGQPLDEPYIYPGNPTDQVVFRVTVPEGRVFVMGDHRADSADSRYHLELAEGTVPIENIVGSAKVIMWPPSRWTTLSSYDEDQSAAAARARR